MAHKNAELFPKITHAVLERDGDAVRERDGDGEHDLPYTSYDEGPISNMVSASPRLVATYRLVRVQLLVKKHSVVAIKQRRRKK